MTTSNVTGTSSATNTPATSAPKNEALANQTVFLQLLIAQLKNQDPANPADGAQFVAQLAQFTTLEQTTQSRINLDQIVKLLQNNQPAKT